MSPMLCKKGLHPMIPENIRMSSGGRICKKCDAMRVKIYSKTSTLTEFNKSRVLASLRAGNSPFNFTTGRRGGSKKIDPTLRLASWWQWNNTLKSDAAFAAIAIPLADANRKAKVRIIRLATPVIWANNGRDTFDAITKATSRIPGWLRGDVQSEMFIDIAEGRLKPEEIPKKVGDYVRRYNRDNKHSVMNPWGDKSLDGALNDDGFSLMDVIGCDAAWSVPANTGRRIANRNSI